MGLSPLDAERKPRWVRAGRSLGHGLTVVIGAVACTALLFFVLPLIRRSPSSRRPT